MKRNHIKITIAVIAFFSCDSKQEHEPVEQTYSQLNYYATPSPTSTSYHPTADELTDGHIPPSSPLHEKDRPPHKFNNMRGFDPASEDDMEDNGMSCYMENNDEEGWD